MPVVCMNMTADGLCAVLCRAALRAVILGLCRVHSATYSHFEPSGRRQESSFPHRTRCLHIKIFNLCQFVASQWNRRILGHPHRPCSGEMQERCVMTLHLSKRLLALSNCFGYSSDAVTIPTQFSGRWLWSKSPLSCRAK